MKLAISKHLTDFVAIIVLIAIAAGVSYYILQNQRLRIPFIEEKAFVLKAEFSTGQAVIAGQGQTVRVSGVRIGDIGGVTLREGRAVIRMDLDQEFKDLVHTNATALLRPKTGLKDMFIDLNPGTADAPVASEGWTIPIRATQPDINPDEIYSALDSDTRDYLKLLVNGAGKGLENRGGDLQDVFARFEPTHRDLAAVNSQVALRRKNLRRLIHNLRVLNTELASDDDELAGLIDSSAAVLRSFASEEQNITAAVRELPSTLSTTTDTLGRVQRFADVLGPAAEKLRPAARALEAANKAIIPAAKELAPILRADIRPFVREARPLVRDLRPSAGNLATATPNLTRSFVQLNNLFNLIGYNPKGQEGPEVADRQEGFLFWIAWLQHAATQLFSSSDAHGVYRPVTLGAPCNTFKQILAEEGAPPAFQDLAAQVFGSQLCATE